jgi:hypothetical protein
VLMDASPEFPIHFLKIYRFMTQEGDHPCETHLG